MRVGVMDEELRDEQWERIAPLLPQHQLRGRPRADDRRTMNGICGYSSPVLDGETCQRSMAAGPRATAG
jgi:hypothetical protein